MPVESTAREALNIQPDAATHGDSGFVQVGFSQFFYQQYGTLASHFPPRCVQTRRRNGAASC